MSSNSAPGYINHPNHRVRIVPAKLHVEVAFAGTVIATSDRALLVDESRHDPVYYIPRSDVLMSALTPTDHSTYCPFKGHARYWTLQVGDRIEENSVWAYDAPYDEALPLQGCVAFYSDRVQVHTSPAASEPE
ncbi:MAG: DUF427 domain-containing protein [Pseudomonadales bacterium]|nr:DUF427 domain-containing protein [Pseudomonadales bacterium]